VIWRVAEPGFTEEPGSEKIEGSGRIRRHDLHLVDGQQQDEVIFGGRLVGRAHSAEGVQVTSHGFRDGAVERGDPAMRVFDVRPAMVVDQDDVGSAERRRD
jgi:hypothetical protein